MTGELSVSAVQMKIHALFNLVKSPFYIVHSLKVREDNKSIKKKKKWCDQLWSKKTFGEDNTRNVNKFCLASRLYSRLGRKQFSSLNMMCVVTVGDCVVRSVLFQWVTVPGVCVVTVGVCVRSVYCCCGWLCIVAVGVCVYCYSGWVCNVTMGDYVLLQWVTVCIIVQ